MSSEIVYGFECVRFTAEEAGGHEDQYILVHQIGSSNCFETRTGRASRDWSIMAVGCKYQVMETVVKAAAYCEGGILKIHGKGGGAYGGVTPETFIRICRKALDNAVHGFNGAAERGLTFDLRLRLYEATEHISPFDKRCNEYTVSELIKVRPMMQDEEYGCKYREFRFDLNEVGEWFKWTNNSRSGWHNGRVHGPCDPRPAQKEMAFAYRVGRS
jgi:hypothetical protein